MSEKDGWHRTYCTRRVFDATIDKLKEVNGRQKAQIKELKKEIRLIEDFLELGPHASAWAVFRNKDPRHNPLG